MGPSREGGRGFFLVRDSLTMSINSLVMNFSWLNTVANPVGEIHGPPLALSL